MDLNDLVIVSVDDHISEPPEMLDKHLSGDDLVGFDGGCFHGAKALVRPFKHHKRQDLTVGALRAKAAASKVDTTPRSCGGAKPLAEGEALRRITSGDLMRKFSHHAQSGDH